MSTSTKATMMKSKKAKYRMFLLEWERDRGHWFGMTLQKHKCLMWFVNDKCHCFWMLESVKWCEVKMSLSGRWNQPVRLSPWSNLAYRWLDHFLLNNCLRPRTTLCISSSKNA
jgi:hypothetical protein